MAELTTANPAVFLFREFVQDILLFPVWWYGKGLAKASALLWRRTKEFVQRSRWSPVIWVKNLFVPMYGTIRRVAGPLVSSSGRSSLLR